MSDTDRTIPRIYAPTVPLHAVNVRHGPVRTVRSLAMFQKAKQDGTQHGIKPIKVSYQVDRVLDGRTVRPRMATSVDVRKQ